METGVALHRMERKLRAKTCVVEIITQHRYEHGKQGLWSLLFIHRNKTHDDLETGNVQLLDDGNP